MCKKAFCSVHGVGAGRVDRIAAHIPQNVTCPSDRRGKHGNRPNAIPQELKEAIDQHIRSFPKRSSHYSRSKNIKRSYLSPDLSVKKMHELYLEKHEPESYLLLIGGKHCRPRVTYDFYYRYFLTNFRLSFGSPRSDTCNTCDMLRKKIDCAANADIKGMAVQEKESHILNADAFYATLSQLTNEAKENNDIEVLSFDYEQNLPLPLVPSGSVFYSRQLWMYNFCIHSGTTGISHFYMYDETLARRGPSEVVSFLHHYLDHYLSPDVRKLYLFSDNCGGQNKNKTMMQFLYTLTRSGYFDKVVHKFPEPGHSFLPCDRCFGLIEKKKRQREHLYLPEEWKSLVRNTSRMFVVVDVDQHMILKYTDHLRPFFKTTIRKGREPFMLSKYRSIEYSASSCDIMCSKEQLNSVGTAFIIQKTDDIISFPEDLLYSSPLPLKTAKYKDVKDLALKFVPLNDMCFYDNLLCDDENLQYDSDVTDDHNDPDTN